MHLLFLDETGKPDEATFGVGGVCVGAGDWEVLRDRWQALCETSRHGGDRGGGLRDLPGARQGAEPPPGKLFTA